MVNRVSLRIGRAAGNMGELVNKFFKQEDISRRVVTVVNLESSCSSIKSDVNTTGLIPEFQCPKCKKRSHIYQQVVMDRLPYYLAISLDRQRDGHNRQMALPDGWDSSLEIEHGLEVDGNFEGQTSVYRLVGGISHAQFHYTAVWDLHNSEEDRAVVFDGAQNNGIATRVSVAGGKRSLNDMSKGRSAAFLIYRNETLLSRLRA